MTSIYDAAKIKCRTFIESINALFNMGKDLETQVNGLDSSKQDTLVSGTNIKTINGGSVLGEGNLAIVGDAPAIESGDAGKALVVNSLEDGAEWSTGIKVADIPANEHNAVNQTWVENVAYSDDTVNNLIHKEGTEDSKGVKYHEGDLLKWDKRFARDTTPATDIGTQTFCYVYDINKNPIGGIDFVFYSNGYRAIRTRLVDKNGTNKYKIIAEIDEDGNVIV